MTRFVFVVCCLLVSGCAFIDDFSRFEVDPNRADAGDAGTPPDARVIDAPGCVARPETCNGEDDDCDGTTDEEPTECSFPNGLVGCVAGSCEMTECVGGFEDCTDEPGCETDPTSDPEHCGGCGMACLTGQVCATSGCAYPRITAHHVLSDSGDARVYEVAVDASGGVVVAGLASNAGRRFSGSVVPGTGTVLARLSTPTTVDWARVGPTELLDLSVGDTGVIFVASTFSGSLSFGTSNVSSRGDTVDGVILSYEPSGAERSAAERGTSDGYDTLRAVEARGGRWAIAGDTDGVFTGEAARGDHDAFVGASITSFAPFPNQYGGPGRDRFYDVALGADGSYTAIGFYYGEAAFGGPSPAPDHGEAVLEQSLIVSSYASDGVQRWQVTHPRYFGESGNEAHITVDDDGNTYWTCGFWGGARTPPDLGAGPLDAPFVIASYDSAGSLRWATSTFANVADADLTVSSDGILYVTGDYFEMSALVPGGDAFPWSGEQDCAVLAYDAATGDFLWGRSINSADRVSCSGVAAQAGGVWVVGSFRGTVDFGGSLETATAGTSDGFLAFIEP
ncbi:MAG TPA: hypothetical protein DEF51_15155 [Myxococcales bacterium]|nr:hypothetical protein [Myxococcales bacterium]